MTPPFNRVLVANRGEIALRILRTAHELDMEVVAVYSDADARSMVVREADVAVRLGPAPASDSYLRADAIIDAARRTGATAIHPGYGFLAERASFAQAVVDAGLAWVGPPPRAIRALGDKLEARRVATTVGVPVVPGTLEPAPVDRRDRVAALSRRARDIGFPLLVKAAAGGGGRGMRRVDSAAELGPALVAASREAAAAFGDGSVYLEREVRPARHVEVQLLGDSRGTLLALGERDCSLQRRHQKLIEEAPAPGLTHEERRRLHELAVTIGRAAGLENAATCEFLREPDGACWFLEVNTRLQVEHPVTELVVGLDLVAEQFRIAAGESLSAAARAAAARATEPIGHAIEVRLLAEDPGRAFAPSPGRITRWSLPGGPGVRVDTATEQGDIVPPDYDPLLAKIVVHAMDRPATVRRLARALAEVDVGGVQTTLPFSRWVAAHPAFEADRLSTDWVAEHWNGSHDTRSPALRAALLAAGLAALSEERRGPTSEDPVAMPTPGTRGIATAGTGTGVNPDGEAPDSWKLAGRRSALERWPR